VGISPAPGEIPKGLVERLGSLLLAFQAFQPIIYPHTRRKSETQLQLLVKPQPQLSPAEAERFKIRTMVERVFVRLKDEFGAVNIRVRGAKKMMALLMFRLLALTVDQLLRLHRQPYYT